MACADTEILVAQARLARFAGIFCEPAAATSLAAAAALAGQGRIRPQDLVVCTVTGHGLKQPADAAARAEPLLTIDPSLSALEGHLRRNPL